MARRFGRSWSAALALALFFMTFATYYTLRPLRNAPSVLVEPASGIVVDDSAKTAPSVELSGKEDGEKIGYMDQDAGTSTQNNRQLETGTHQVFPPSTPTSVATQHDTSPTPAQNGEQTTLGTIKSESPSEQQSPTTKVPTTLTDVTENPEVTKAFLNETIPEETSDSSQTEGTSGDHPPEGYAVEEEDEQAEEEPEEPPPPPPPSKILVMGKLTTEDTDWVQQELTDWQNHIYVVDLEPEEESPTGHKTKMNKAREAMPYLTYIVHHYPDFPDVVAFIHPHRRGMPMAWHNDARGNDAVNMMRDLKIETVLDRGYVNLRCNNEVGCPDEVQPFRDPPDPKKFAEHAFPYVYGHFFNATFTHMRETIPVVATQCCAQFAVSKQQILKRPKHEYVRYRKFLEETHYDDATVGRVMEYMWHIIFGRDAVHCENVFDCWCAVYGRCFGHGRGGGGGGWHP